MRFFWIGALVLVPGCAEPQPDAQPSATRTDSVQVITAAADATPAASHADSIISTRMVIFMHATPADLDSLRTRYSEDDVATIFDDAMWYRATAYEYLEQLKLPVQQVEGKRAFTFRVQGAPRVYDFRAEELLDVIVLYEPEREPRSIAPVDIQVAAEYFGIKE